MSRQEQRRAQVSVFAAELAAARQHAGLTQDGLAASIHFSASTIAMVEAGHRAPSLDFARALDRQFGTPVGDGRGTFERLYHVVRSIPLPSWFRRYAEVEATATQVRSWQPALVEGLLQTEEYARVVLSGRPNTRDEDVESLVTARMERQEILGRAQPPLLWAVMDEAVLHRQIAGGKVMRDQLEHLSEMAERPNINVEVVPYSAGPHYALLGAFNIAESDELTRLAYLETVTEGYSLESPSAVAEVALIFDTVRSETLSRTASRDLIRKLAEDL